MTVNVNRVIAAIAMLAFAGCAATPPAARPSSPTVTPRPPPSSYDEVTESLCAAWQALDRAVGNPDSGEGSELSDSLEAAAKRRDAAAAERAGTQIVAELETARQHAAEAGRWEPAAKAAEQMDRLLLAFKAMAEAQMEQARGSVSTDNGYGDPGQAAFEQAGGMQAWMGTLDATQELISQRPDGPPRQCGDIAVYF